MKSIFPYKPRKGQISIMENIYDAIQEQNVIMISAPTGLGKTICSLVPAIKSGKQILFLTPRRSQHDIVVQSAKDIDEKLSVACIVGKQSMCDNSEIKNGGNFYDMCNVARKRNSKIPCTLFHDGLCRYYEEIKKAQSADIVTANYRHVFDPDVGEAFKKLTKFCSEDMILIVDEAHNLPSVLRDIASTKITNITCDRAQNEIELLHRVGEDIKISKSISDVIMTVISFDDNKRRVDKSIIQISELDELCIAGEKVIKIKVEDGAVAPVSYLLSMYKFFSLWRDADDITFIRIFERDRNNWSLNIKCLEPGSLCSPVYEFSSAILMSGTLQPLDYFRNVLGLGTDVVMKSYPSIFPPENRTIIMNEHLTTKYSERTTQMIANYGKTISDICDMKGNVAIFFPSYTMMRQIKSHIKTSKRIISENSGSTFNVHKELESRDNLLLGVMRGKLAEGVDYKDNLLSAIGIAGLPFPMQDIELNALTYYYENKFGGGFVYASLFPTINVVLQAVGRGIRSETDKCCIYLLDKRFNTYKRWFK